jgi:hypothetical protein
MSGLVSRLVSEPTTSGRVISADIDQVPQATPSPLVPSGDDRLAPSLGDTAESADTEPASTADDTYRKRENDNGTSEVDLNPASLQLDDDEVRFLGELLPILDSSPRGLKRYINIYRLIKTVVGEPSPLRTCDARRRMFLLTILTSFPYGSDVITYIIDSPSPRSQTLGDRITEYLGNRQAGNPDLPECKTLASWLAEQTMIANCPIHETLEDARHVRLYSFT